MRIISVCVILFCQIVMAVFFCGALPLFRWHLLKAPIALPLPTEIALALSHGVGAFVHVLPLIVSAYLVLRLLLKRKEFSQHFTTTMLLMIALTILQIVVGGFCALALMLPFYC